MVSSRRLVAQPVQDWHTLLADQRRAVNSNIICSTGLDIQAHDVFRRTSKIISLKERFVS